MVHSRKLREGESKMQVDVYLEKYVELIVTEEKLRLLEHIGIDVDRILALATSFNQKENEKTIRDYEICRQRKVGESKND